MTDIAIIIVSWNCREFLSQCLDSIEKERPRCTIEVIVVDNASTDGTVDFLRKRASTLRLIENKDNRGFAAANNQGITASDSRYILLLNPDTLVIGGALDTLKDFMDATPSASAVGPTILDGDRHIQWAGVRFPSNWNILVEALFLDRLFPHNRIFGRHKEMYSPSDAVREVDYVQGSCLMVRREIINTVGLLDESFFMYFEETDWCYRIKGTGGVVYVVGPAAIVHFGSVAPGHYDERRLVHYHRSLFLFYRKHYSIGRRVLLRPIIMLRCILKLFLWIGVGIVVSRLRKAARSSIFGYGRVFLMTFQERV